MDCKAQKQSVAIWIDATNPDLNRKSKISCTAIPIDKGFISIDTTFSYGIALDGGS